MIKCFNSKACKFKENKNILFRAKLPTLFSATPNILSSLPAASSGFPTESNDSFGFGSDSFPKFSSPRSLSKFPKSSSSTYETVKNDDIGYEAKVPLGSGFKDAGHLLNVTISGNTVKITGNNETIDPSGGKRISKISKEVTLVSHRLPVARSRKFYEYKVFLDISFLEKTTPYRIISP